MEKDTAGRGGFTLIELLMVVALIALVATMAVTKIGGLRGPSERKISLANQKAVERAVEGYVAFARRGIDRLDSLIDEEVQESDQTGFFDPQGSTMSATGSGFWQGPDDLGYPLPEIYSEKCSGLTPAMVSQVLTPYALSENEAYSLANRGFKYVLRHATRAKESPRAAYNEKGDDNAYLPDDETLALDPNRAACIPRAFTNGMVVAAISPFTPMGREIYRGCGANLLPNRETAADYIAAAEDVKAEVAAAGGALLAFGLGDDASIVGDPQGGIESAPVAAYPNKKFYSRYILLFRVDASTRAGEVEFAGVIDPCGNNERAARNAIKSL